MQRKHSTKNQTQNENNFQVESIDIRIGVSLVRLQTSCVHFWPNGMSIEWGFFPLRFQFSTFNALKIMSNASDNSEWMVF